MRKLFSCLVPAAIVALSCASASAETLTFTDLPVSPSNYMPNPYHSLTWGNFAYGDPYIGYVTGFPEYGAYTINGDQSNFVTTAGTFTLVSLTMTSSFLTDENVQLFGYGVSPNSYTPPQIIDQDQNGVNVSPGSTTTVDLGWSGLTSVELNPRGGTLIGSYTGPNGGSVSDVIITSMTFTFDGVGAAPEPPAVVLFGIGALGVALVAFMHRRRGSLAA